MRVCRYRLAGQERYGLVEGTAVRPLSAAPWSGGLPDGKAVPLAEVTLLAPVEPSKIVCVGRNYRAHAKELGNEVPAVPLLFLKPPTAVVGPQDAIRCPEQSREVHHEAELAVVVGRPLARASAVEARLAPERACRSCAPPACARVAAPRRSRGRRPRRPSGRARSRPPGRSGRTCRSPSRA